MAEALLPHSPGGPVELCIGVCSAEFRTLSSQTYSFVVREKQKFVILVITNFLLSFFRGLSSSFCRAPASAAYTQRKGPFLAEQD